MIIGYLLFGLFLLIDIFMSYRSNNKILKTIIKVLCLAGVIASSLYYQLSFNICSCLLLLESLMNKYLLKDKSEDYFIGFKGVVFIYFSLKFLNLSYITSSIIFLACNLYLLVMYVLNKDIISRVINFILLFAVMILGELFSEAGFTPSLINLILYFVDFYILYSSSNNKLFNILFVILFGYGFFNMFMLLSSRYIIALFLVFAFFVAITRKNKFVFNVSLLGFLLSSMYYFIFTIETYNIVYILSVIMTLISLLIFYEIMLKKYHE